MTILFTTLWAWHPSNLGNDKPCTTDGNINFENQCAIRMGECFSKSGVFLGSFSGAKCYPGHKHNQSHILRAQELADWMKTQFIFFGDVEIESNTQASNYADKKGIVFLKNFWGPRNQGDHIDLWNGSRMPGGDSSYFFLAQEIWFWEIN